MRALKFFILLLFPAFFLFCVKKNYPDPIVVENSAVYFSQMTIDNQRVVLQAGVDGYYMYSSCKLDSNHVYGFIADLKKADCSDCNSRLKIQINDYQVSVPNISSLIDSSFRIKRYPILAGDPVSSYSVKFTSIAPGATSYKWDFGQGHTSTEANPVFIFNKADKYTVCLTADNGSCQNSICGQQKIDTLNTSCKTRIDISSKSGNSIIFTSITTGLGPFKYFWRFPDGSTSDQSVAPYTSKYSGAFSVSLRVVDRFGDTAYANYNAKTLTDLSSCTTNYSITATKRILAKPPLSQIIITWVDANGVVYTSNNELQPQSSNFEILSVTDNDPNEKGEPTKKITARFNCKLYNGSKSISVNDAEVVICVAHK